MNKARQPAKAPAALPPALAQLARAPLDGLVEAVEPVRDAGRSVDVTESDLAPEIVSHLTLSDSADDASPAPEEDSAAPTPEFTPPASDAEADPETDDESDADDYDAYQYYHK